MGSSQTMEDNPERPVSAATVRGRRAVSSFRKLGATPLCVSLLLAGAALAGLPAAIGAPAAEARAGDAVGGAEDVSITLKPGAHGPAVAALQGALRRAGFLGTVDGDYGPQTEHAVRSFQREAGVEVDGIAGPATLTILYGRYGEEQLVHVVARGESLWQIARDYDVTVDELRDANSATSDTIRPGDRLRLPARASLAHRSLAVPAFQDGSPAADRANVAAGGPTPLHYVIRRGDSLSVLAHRFGSSVNEIAAENGISDPSQIQVGQSLIIPVELRGGTIGDARLTGSLRPGLLLPPVEGPVSSPYGARIHPISGTRDFHSGIDIAVPAGTPVRAAFYGIVREARWMGGLGFAVVIDHGQGITTRYGHNSKLLVQPGDEVRRGEIVAESGSTGLSTGPHVHFMVLRNGETLNPSDWLP